MVLAYLTAIKYMPLSRYLRHSKGEWPEGDRRIVRGVPVAETAAANIHRQIPGARIVMMIGPILSGYISL